MAKRRKKAKHRTRRHRVGALNMKPGSPLVKFGSIAAGYLLGNTINPLINKAFGTPTDPVKTGKIVAIGQMAAGSALLFLKTGKKSMVQEVAGGILLGTGIKRAMEVFKSGATTMGGYGDVPVIGAYRVPGQLGAAKKVAGYGDVPVIGSYSPNQALNGRVMGSMDNSSGMTAASGSTLMG